MSFYPSRISDEAQLDDLLAEPTESLIDVLRRLTGDIVILGAGGKLGPGIARMARRAADAVGTSRDVTAVSRFTDGSLPDKLNSWGVRTHTADLFNPEDVARLPDADLVVFLVGRKFGTRETPWLTWATNVSLPTIVCQRYFGSRIVALSTLCVYPFVSPESGGSQEADPPAPAGEYAYSTLGRERVFEHFSRVQQIRTALIRLTYSVELRYGVLVDIARRVWNDETVDLSMEFVNLLWQGDVNARVLAALEAATVPARPVNVAGPGFYRVEDLARQFAARFDKPVRFSGESVGDAWLPAVSQIPSLAEEPRVSLEQLIDWTADWIRRDCTRFDKPTHFEVRDGQF